MAKHQTLTSCQDKTLADLVDYTGKENYPLFLFMDFSRSTGRKFFIWAIENDVFYFKDLCKCDINKMSEEWMTERRFSTLLLALKGVEEIELPSDIIRYAMDDPFVRSLQSNHAERFPATSRFGCIREILGIQDSDAYKITAFSTVMLIKKIWTKEFFEKIIASYHQHKAYSQKALNYYYTSVGVIKPVQNTAKKYPINEMFYDLEYKGHALKEVDNLSIVSVRYKTSIAFTNRFEKIYPAIDKNCTDFEEGLKEAIQKYPKYEMVCARASGQTLQMVGQACGNVTRECVRQTMDKFYDIYLDVVRVWARAEMKSVTSLKPLFKDDLLNRIFTPYLYTNVRTKNHFLTRQGYIVSISWYTRLVDEVKGYLDKNGYYTKNEFAKVIKKYGIDLDSDFAVMEDSGLFEIMNLKARENAVCEPFHYSEIAKTASLIVLKHFKDGIAVYSDDIEKLKDIALKDFGVDARKRSWSATILRCEDIILSDRGYYSHVKTINYDDTALLKTVNDIKKQLEEDLFVSTRCWFESHRAELQNSGIKNEHLLYGLLTKEFKDTFDYRKYVIYQKGSPLVSKSVTDILFDYIVENGPVFKDEFVKKFHLDCSMLTCLTISKPIVLKDDGKVIAIWKSEDYSTEFKHAVFKAIDEDIEKYGSVFKTRLWGDVKVSAEKEGIKDETELYSICRQLLRDDEEYIVKNSFICKGENIKPTRILDGVSEFMKGKGVMSISELAEEYSEYMGFNKERIMINLYYAPTAYFRLGTKSIVSPYDVEVSKTTKNILKNELNHYFNKNSKLSYSDFEKMDFSKASVKVNGKDWNMTWPVFGSCVRHYFPEYIVSNAGKTAYIQKAI